MTKLLATTQTQTHLLTSWGVGLDAICQCRRIKDSRKWCYRGIFRFASLFWKICAIHTAIPVETRDKVAVRNVWSEVLAVAPVCLDWVFGCWKAPYNLLWPQSNGLMQLTHCGDRSWIKALPAFSPRFFVVTCQWVWALQRVLLGLYKGAYCVLMLGT